MACRMQAITLWSSSSLKQIENFEKSGFFIKSWHSMLNWNRQSLGIYCAKLFIRVAPFPGKGCQSRRSSWEMAFALNTGGIPSNDGQDNMNSDNSDLGQTRLGRLMSAGGRQLLERLNSTRKNFPMKIFLLLLGFYTANALATILGQTGDWDVLVAGIVVAAIEGIGMLMYKKPSSLSSGRLQSLVMMINYWKAGVCLGLFVDAFKLGS